MDRSAVFLITAADRKGLVARITGFFAGMNLNIVECRQYTDILEKLYYMRAAVELPPELTRAVIEAEFQKLADELELQFSIHYSGEVQNVAVMVSKTTHCLYDLLTNSEENLLGPGKVRLVIGNHPELEEAAEKFRIPFYCFPVTRSGDPEQERQIIELLEKQKIDLVVLARYMRILSDDFIKRFPARIINIHHAFLPAFISVSARDSLEGKVILGSREDVLADYSNAHIGGANAVIFKIVHANTTPFLCANAPAVAMISFVSSVMSSLE